MPWQRRVLDRPTGEDYTRNEPGTHVVIETAEVVMCPHCGRPGLEQDLLARVPDSSRLVEVHLVRHAIARDGEATDVCVEVGDGQPALRLWNSAGDEVYSGPSVIPPDRAN